MLFFFPSLRISFSFIFFLLTEAILPRLLIHQPYSIHNYPDSTSPAALVLYLNLENKNRNRVRHFSDWPRYIYRWGQGPAEAGGARRGLRHERGYAGRWREGEGGWKSGGGRTSTYTWSGGEGVQGTARPDRVIHR
jgi:hypothetical protein